MYRRDEALDISGMAAEASRKSCRDTECRRSFGSVESADVRLTGDGVAPIHAVIELNHDVAKDTYSPTIYDLASESGMFINDKKGSS